MTLRWSALNCNAKLRSQQTFTFVNIDEETQTNFSIDRMIIGNCFSSSNNKLEVKKRSERDTHKDENSVTPLLRSPTRRGTLDFLNIYM